jgi:hypothetical protein
MASTFRSLLTHWLSKSSASTYMGGSDEHGGNKRHSDIIDAQFLCNAMANRDERVSDACAARSKFGYFHMLEFREELGRGSLDMFLQIRGRRFLLPWEENTQEQRDYYECFADPGSGPLTTTLREEA